MSSTPPAERLTLLLQASGDDADRRRAVAFAAVYDQLRRIASGHLERERSGHTLQATALVHEAWLRLFGGSQVFANGREFFVAAAGTMRRILIDHARTRGRLRRGGRLAHVALDALELATHADPAHLLAIDDALTALELQDARLAEQAKLRLFAGLDEGDVAAMLGVSDRTARRDWVLARAFLQDHLQQAE